MSLSNREQNIFAWLICETGITVYYFWNVLRMPVDTLLLSKGMFQLVLSVIGLSVLACILVSIFVNGHKNKETADERDHVIEGKAIGYAYRAMIGAIAFFIVHLYLNQGLDLSHLPYQFDWFLRPMPITAFTILNAMVAILWFAEMVKYGGQLWLYQRE